MHDVDGYQSVRQRNRTLFLGANAEGGEAELCSLLATMRHVRALGALGDKTPVVVPMASGVLFPPPHGDIDPVAAIDEQGGKLANKARVPFDDGLVEPLGARVIEARVAVGQPRNQRRSQFVEVAIDSEPGSAVFHLVSDTVKVSTDLHDVPDGIGSQERPDGGGQEVNRRI